MLATPAFSTTVVEDARCFDTEEGNYIPDINDVNVSPRDPGTRELGPISDAQLHASDGTYRALMSVAVMFMAFNCERFTRRRVIVACFIAQVCVFRIIFETTRQLVYTNALASLDLLKHLG